MTVPTRLRPVLIALVMVAISIAHSATDPAQIWWHVAYQEFCYGPILVAVERALIQFALDTHGGNRTHAAQFLGLSRSALLYRMQKHHLVRPQTAGPDPEQS